ncbi:hypothetical protein FB451DRAFT_1433443 [Mycena latifolia]|nr:hypothetical protein FB451DRAFT_1433443 [Mycena latifolia]
MPPKPSTHQIRLTNIIVCLESALNTLNETARAFDTPFLPAISSTTLSLISAVKFLEHIYRLLHAIINLHIKAKDDVPLAFLHHIGNFTETVHKIHVFVEAQQDGNKLKYFFRQSEMNQLLANCKTGLEQALDVFKVDGLASISADIVEMRNNAQKQHEQLLELISSLSDTATSEKSSSIYSSTEGFRSSSNSMSILPAMPRIFHGRDSELQDIVNALTNEPARVAILGPAGIGKTSLARAVIHHPDIPAKYGNCFFVGCESATTSIELAGLIGSYLGLKPGPDQTKSVVQHFSSGSSCLLVLDNLETPWEAVESRADVEEFLSLLTDVPHLALIITMRGAERPAKVRWTRPFLLPLKPLTYKAARETFVDIADDFHDPREIDELLHLTDNMPLAVNLIAHLVDYEGCRSVLSRWKTEKTSLLSDGYDKKSNLEMSIELSLTGSRVSPGAKDLLSLLSILPDGLSDVELLQGNLPIEDILQCKAALVRTSLAYSDNTRQLKVLMPIREYMQNVYPPSEILVQPLRKYFHEHLEFHRKYGGFLSGAKAVARITSNFANIQNILLLGLQPNDPDLEDTIWRTISFNGFSRATGRGYSLLMDQVPNVLPKPIDHKLEAFFITEMVMSWRHHPIENPEALVTQAQNNFRHFKDLELESQFYNNIGDYYMNHNNDISEAMSHLQTALSLARSCGDTNWESSALVQIAGNRLRSGHYSEALQYANKAERLAKLSGNLYQEARALRVSSLTMAGLSDYRHSLVSSHRARALLSLCGLSEGEDDHGIMVTEAQVHLLSSEYGDARKIHAYLIDRTSPEHEPVNHAFALLTIAEIDVITGAAAAKIRLNLDTAKMILTTMGYQVGIIACDTVFADLDLREGNLAAAKALFKKCLKLSWGKYSDVVSYCLERLGDISRWSIADINGTSCWATIFLLHGLESKEKLATNKALRCLGDMFLAGGDRNTALSLFMVALEGFTQMDVHRSRADCMLRMGEIFRQSGEFTTALQFWTTARPLFERTMQEMDVARIDSRIAMTEKLSQDRKPLPPLSNLELNALARSLRESTLENPSVTGDVGNPFVNH